MTLIVKWLAILVFAGFLAVLIMEVPRIDLGLVILFTFGMMLYDFLVAGRKRSD